MPTVNVNLVATSQPFPLNWSVEFPEGGNVIVPAGDSETITWQLLDAPLTAAFSSIAINPEAGAPPWPNQPSEPDWSTTDQNSLTGGVGETWSYVVTVAYKGHPYVHDPQITNPPPTIARQLRS